ncbi:MAG: hypothetical protein N4A59_00770 [Marinifilum sp.]|nr:hypothetical protein [Marinifilum sp.]
MTYIFYRNQVISMSTVKLVQSNNLMNSVITKIYGQRIMDGDLLFDDQKISFSNNTTAALINVIAMVLVTISSAFNIINNDRELTNTLSIAILMIAVLASLLGIFSVKKYLKTKKQNKISFTTQDIKEVIIQEKPKLLRINFYLNDNTSHKISCTKDRHAGKLVQFLRDKDVNLNYL